ncbi:MAG: 2-phosphosulfolactate phosphatase [Candidatus Eisenbacteria bacterium]
MKVRVHLTPPPRGSAGGPGFVGVAVDVLRATSTLTAASAHGAARIVPFAETAEALRFRDATPGTLACGERDGRIVAGFDLGNSPFEYGPDVVGGRTLAFASTNGSRAMLALERCDRVLLGAFVNASALRRLLLRDGGEAGVEICCAGTLGRFSHEDAAFAGWLCRALAAAGAELEGEAAVEAAAAAPADASGVRARVEGAPHARYLCSLGAEFVRDVEWCATLDRLDHVASL